MRTFLASSLIVFVVTHAATDADALWIDLGTLDGVGSSAAAINEAGEVTGTFWDSDVLNRGFLYSGGSMTALPTLGGPTSVPAYPGGINNAGAVVGLSRRSADINDFHAFLFSGGVMTDLGTLGGGWSAATDVNDAEQIVGTAETTTAEVFHAFRYEAGLMTDLGTLGGSYSRATAINAGGDVVGDAETTGGEMHAYLYSGGMMTDLGTLGGAYSTAVAINDAGRVVGRSETASGESHAFLYSGGTMIDLGALGGSYSTPTDINEVGQVVGTWQGSGPIRGFVYDNGVMTDLGGLGRTPATIPRAINDAGVVVGASYTGNPALVSEQHAFIYEKGVIRELSAGTRPGPDGGNSDAAAINNTGQIVGSSYVGPGAQPYAFLLERTSPSCPTSPAATCSLGAVSAFDVKGIPGGEKNRIAWKWSKGGAVAQAELGSPATTTGYSVCVYDSIGGVDVLATSLRLGLNLRYWTDRDPRGWQYKERKGFEDGITGLQLVAGAAGKTRARFNAKGDKIPMPIPVSAGSFFAQEPRVTVQLHTDASSTCWTSEFTGATANDGARFSARSR